MHGPKQKVYEKKEQFRITIPIGKLLMERSASEFVVPSRGNSIAAERRPNSSVNLIQLEGSFDADRPKKTKMDFMCWQRRRLMPVTMSLRQNKNHLRSQVSPETEILIVFVKFFDGRSQFPRTIVYLSKPRRQNGVLAKQRRQRRPFANLCHTSLCASVTMWLSFIERTHIAHHLVLA